ncbi:MAG: hypothetical protein ACM3X9_06815 [Bacillota bacterium]
MTINKSGAGLSVTPFGSSFTEFLISRCEQIMAEKVLPDPEFRHYRAKIVEAAENICGCLNADHKEQYYTLESAEGLSLNIAARIIYLQGVIDGVGLRSFLENE